MSWASNTTVYFIRTNLSLCCGIAKDFGCYAKKAYMLSLQNNIGEVGKRSIKGQLHATNRRLCEFSILYSYIYLLYLS